MALTVGALATVAAATTVGGYLGLLTAIAAWYCSFAGVANTTYGRTILPTDNKWAASPIANTATAPGTCALPSAARAQAERQEVRMARRRAVTSYRSRPATVVVPDFTGLIVRGLLARAAEAGLQVAIHDEPAPIQTLVDSARWVVIEQDPAPGSTRYEGDTVVVRLGRDGGGNAGVRKPRRPLPPRRHAHEEYPPETLGDGDVSAPAAEPGR